MSPQPTIYLGSLDRVITSLEEIFREPKTTIVRDATIQRFEYTFELAIKMMKRVLEAMPGGSTIDQESYRDFIRIAAEAGIVSNPEAWFGYRDARNISSHAYDVKKAEQVYASAQAFVVDVRKIYQELVKRV